MGVGLRVLRGVVDFDADRRPGRARRVRSRPDPGAGRVEHHDRHVLLHVVLLHYRQRPPEVHLVLRHLLHELLRGLLTGVVLLGPLVPEPVTVAHETSHRPSRSTPGHVSSDHRGPQGRSGRGSRALDDGRQPVDVPVRYDDPRNSVLPFLRHPETRPRPFRKCPHYPVTDLRTVGGMSPTPSSPTPTPTRKWTFPLERGSCNLFSSAVRTRSRNNNNRTLFHRDTAGPTF